jgi:hypothetical protein
MKDLDEHVNHRNIGAIKLSDPNQRKEKDVLVLGSIVSLILKSLVDMPSENVDCLFTDVRIDVLLLAGGLEDETDIET